MFSARLKKSVSCNLVLYPTRFDKHAHTFKQLWCSDFFCNSMAVAKATSWHRPPLPQESFLRSTVISEVNIRQIGFFMLLASLARFAIFFNSVFDNPTKSNKVYKIIFFSGVESWLGAVVKSNNQSWIFTWSCAFFSYINMDKTTPNSQQACS